MKKLELQNLIKSILKEQNMGTPPAGRTGRKIVTELKLDGFSEEEVRELEETINRDFPGGINIGGSGKKIKFSIKWKWPPWTSLFSISISF